MSHQLQRPNQQTVLRVNNIVEQYGINLTSEVLEVIIAAHEAILFGSPDGRQSIADRFKMDITQGDTDMEYRVVDVRPELKVNGKDIFFFSATVVKGQFVPPSNVDSYKIDKNSCDMCGSTFHCTQQTKDEMGKPLSICNFCSSRSDVQRVRDSSNGDDGCKTCSVLSCTHHPYKSLDTSWITQGG